MKKGDLDLPVTKLDITSVTPFAGGQSFGEVGAYNHLKGTAHFSVDPLHPNNTAITDIELAPRDSEGRVHFSADFEMLQPADPPESSAPEAASRMPIVPEPPLIESNTSQ